jgi:CheY-like chemotaxis protein/two-component sensor histidine kinase
VNEATVERALEIIERNAKLQNKLIDDILDISRIIQNRLRLNLQPIHLVPIINAAVEALQPIAQTKSIHIESLLDPVVGLVMGDAERLQQIVWNLVSNAVKFTPNGGQVSVKLEQVGTQAQITVRDTGQGISADFLPLVFERFRQADSSKTRSQGGLGLGLAIVRHLVEMHNGTAYATSEGEGRGATFTVQLPIHQIAPLLQSIDRDPNSSNKLPNLNGLKILVVDDDLDSRELTAFVLEQCQAQIIKAVCAEEALQILLKTEIDLLVSDIGMPDEDGYSLIRIIRTLNSEQKRQIPAVALTAFAKEQDQQEAIAAGFQHHLAKPVNPDKLIEIIASLAK